MEIPFEIELDFMPTQLSITEHIIGCSNSEFMCVFKISEQNFYNTANSLTTSSELSVMAAMPICPLTEHPTDAVLDYESVSKKFLASITSNIFSTFDHHTIENNGEGAKFGRDRSIELKPSFLDNGIPLGNLRHFDVTNDGVSEIHLMKWGFFLLKKKQSFTDGFWSFQAYKEYTLRTLVQVKQHDTNDPFQCLVLSPIYSRKQKETDGTNIFRSRHGSSFIGISVLLATVNEGYLYQFSNNGMPFRIFSCDLIWIDFNF